MRGSNAPFFMALIIDGVELGVRWAEDQSLDPKTATKRGDKKAATKPEFEAMKKAELVEYLSPNGNSIDTTLTKAELLKLAQDKYAQQS
jgi:hypothetical protein